MKPFEAALVGAREVVVDDRLDVGVADRGLHPDPADGRRRRQASSTSSAWWSRSRSSPRRFVSLTVTPMLAARLPARRGQAPGAVAAAFARAFDRTLDGYGGSVGWCLRHRAVVMLVFLATVAASGYLFSTMPVELLPDRGHRPADVSTEARAGHLLPRDVGAAAEGRRRSCAGNPAVDHVTSIVGGGFHSAVNSGHHVRPAEGQVGPPAARRDAAGAAPLARPGRRHPRASSRRSRACASAAAPRKSQYQLVVQSLDRNKLSTGPASWKTAMRADPHFIDVTSDSGQRAAGERRRRPRPRRQLGVTAAALRSALEAGFGGDTVATIQSNRRQLQRHPGIRPELPLDGRACCTNIHVPVDLRQAGAAGELRPRERTTGPVTVNQTGQLAADHAVLQPAAGRRARRRDAAGHRAGKPDRPALRRLHRLCRHRKGVPAVASRTRPC